MFLLLVSSLLITSFMIRKPRKYKVTTIEAVTNNTHLTLVHTPTDIPEDVDFFLITITNGYVSRKIARRSTTVPNHMRVSPKLDLKQAVILYKSGSTDDVTDVIQPYVGHNHNFDHHVVTLPDILKLEGFENVLSISFIWSDKSYFKNNFLTTLLL